MELAIGIILGCCALGAGTAMIAESVPVSVKVMLSQRLVKRSDASRNVKDRSQAQCLWAALLPKPPDFMLW